MKEAWSRLLTIVTLLAIWVKQGKVDVCPHLPSPKHAEYDQNN